MSEPSTSVPLDLTDDDTLSPLEWAEDVMWASKRIHLSRLDGKTKGRPPKHAPEGVSANRFALWQFGQENQKEMITNLVPRALAIKKEFAGRDNNEVLRQTESLQIEKMRGILTAALAEAKTTEGAA